MNYISIIPETSVDGEGLRTSIYVTGCKHHCKGCHNPQTWDFKAGCPLTEEVISTVIDHVKKNPLLNGITFSGGDPLEEENAKDLVHFLKMIKDENINIWCYTGYVYEYFLSCGPNGLLCTPEQWECLQYIDILVDGQYIEMLRDPDLQFRGSSNQRIINLAKIRERIKN